MMLRRDEIVDILAEKTGLYKQDLKRVLLALKELVYEEVAKGNSIFIQNLFRIDVITTKPTRRYNKMLDDFYIDKPHKKVKMKPSRKLVDSVNEKKMKKSEDIH